MSGELMDASIAAAIEAGRSIIVPTAQRAAALRWNWARAQRARGLEVWDTPEVLTWEAWLDSRWQRARHGVALRRLNRSQQRSLWEGVLRTMHGRFGTEEELSLHAPALMQGAARATQSLLVLSRSAVSEEEQLLVAALAGFRQQCERLQAIALPLATMEQLAPLLEGPAPWIVGQPRLTALQQALAERCWPGQPILYAADSDARPMAEIRQVRAADLESEIRACAAWCRAQLESDAGRRLLVISAASDPSLSMQGVMLWRALAQGIGGAAAHEPAGTLLTIEGGEPLIHQVLIADVLAALRLSRDVIDWSDLSQVLRGAYFNFGEHRHMLQLEAALAAIGRARWPRLLLNETLLGQCAPNPAAQVLAAWLAAASWRESPTASATQWAEHFSQWLQQSGFARGAALHSSDAQRVTRWGELLDEFAGLDAVAEPLSRDAALVRLQQLAGETLHAPESSDAAITLSAFRGAPVARYDGIWVLGLTEQRWPEPPRPNAYVALAEQRRALWEEASARQRLEQARWTQTQWQACATELVLSYALREGDVRHRPSALLSDESWIAAADEDAAQEPYCTAPLLRDASLPRMVATPDLPLPKGLLRLRLQQQCAFRAQAQVRLGAEPPVRTGEGIDPRLRGELLHGLLEGIWQELGDRAGLLALDEPQRRALILRNWRRLMQAQMPEGARGLRQLERERLRAEHLLLRVLEMDAARPAFTVIAREHPLRLASAAGTMALRIDRIDADGDGSFWLIDYKSGRPEPMRLEQGSAQPLQLALYEQALAQSGQLVQGLALLSLNPVEPGYTGAAMQPQGWPGRWKSVPDWPVQRALWRAELDRLLQEHLQGEASVAPLRDACRYCHLPALCRRGDLAVAEEATEPAKGSP